MTLRLNDARRLAAAKNVTGAQHEGNLVPYIIDGHNLIAAMPDIRLDEANDERALLDRLQMFAQRQRRTLYVYFDRGDAGGQNRMRSGRIHVRFSVPPRTADDAIQSKLRSIGGEGPNWVVVSSDREIREQAVRVGARSVSSHAFSRELEAGSGSDPDLEKPAQPLTKDEIEAWETLFRSRSGED